MYCEHCGTGPVCIVCGRDDRRIIVMPDPADAKRWSAAIEWGTDHDRPSGFRFIGSYANRTNALKRALAESDRELFPVFVSPEM